MGKAPLLLKDIIMKGGIMKTTNTSAARIVPVHSAHKTTRKRFVMNQFVNELAQAHSAVKTMGSGVNETARVKKRLLEIAERELSVPLDKIINAADLIERSYDTLSKQNVLNELTTIKTAATYMSAILNDFLSLEKADIDKLQPDLAAFDLKGLTETIVGQMKKQTRDWQDIKYTHKGSSSHISLDKELLRHCLVNLISNAIKYSDVADHIEVGSEISGDMCRIWVKDYGLGVPEGEKERLFEPFFRASNVSHIKGTGLGLNLVKRYTELMGGRVTIENNAEKGTTFSLVFPIAAQRKKRGATQLAKIQ